MENLFLSFYVVEGLQKKNIVHKKHVGTAIYKLVSCLVVLFFYLVNIILIALNSLSGEKMNFSLGPYRWYFIIGFLVLVFLGIRYLKRYYLGKYPNPIDIKSFDAGRLKKFKTNVIVLSLLVVVPVILFALYLFLS